MNPKELRIVFMGTPQFAVQSLKVLIENHYCVVGVVTMPDKPAGRGRKLQESAIKQYAKSQNLPILQPEKLKDEIFLNRLRTWNADLQIVVAFRMLPEVVWNMPPMGTFNLHASLLPQYRGAAPINWAIINGEKETGVTTFFLTHEIDTGAIIAQQKTTIYSSDNAGKIHDTLMIIGADLVVNTINAIAEKSIKPKPQAQSIGQEKLKSAPKIFRETCRIDWEQPATKIHNFIRGLSPYPTAWTHIHDITKKNISLKIFDSEVIATHHSLAPGNIETDSKSYLNVATSDGFICVTEVQLAGKKRMKTTDFLRGFSFLENARLV